MTENRSPREDRHGLDRREFLLISGASIVAFAGSGTVSATSQGPTVIEDWHDLAAVRNSLDGDYVLATDLDEQTPGYNEQVGDSQGGWKPIGDADSDADIEFTGTFDGQGHQIADLEIDQPGNNRVGLFGVNEGMVKDVEVTSADITGNSLVGGLVGTNEIEGEVVGSKVAGAVTGDANVGGLVGINWGEVVESEATGTVTGNKFVGGLVGEMVSRGEVVESKATGEVTGDSSVGGLVGLSRGEVVESEATGDVTGDSRVGGLVGFNDRGEIVESEATGEVTGEEEVGDLVGFDTGADADDDGFGPGFGVGGALASVGGATYFFKQRLNTTERSFE